MPTVWVSIDPVWDPESSVLAFLVNSGKFSHVISLNVTPSGGLAVCVRLPPSHIPLRLCSRVELQIKYRCLRSCARILFASGPARPSETENSISLGFLCRISVFAAPVCLMALVFSSLLFPLPNEFYFL